MKYSHLGSNYCWNSVGTASAGTATSAIADPRCVYITPQDLILLCGHNVGRVLQCRTNQTSTSDATTNYGDHIDYISFSSNGSMFTNDHDLDRVRRYDPNTLPNGVLVAGAGSSVSGTLQRPVGTAVDDNFNLYIGDQDGDRIYKLVPGGTSLVSVINTNPTISKPSALLLPDGTSNEIFISDEDGTAVFLWPFGATSPRVTYTNVQGGSTLSKPRGMKLDPLGNLYVADQNNNRVVMFCKNSTTGIVVMNTPKKTLDLAFDSNMNLFILEDDGKLYKHTLR